MPYKSAVVERICMVRWGTTPQTRQDVDTLLKEFQDIQRTVGPPIGIALVPPELPQPEGEMRKYINQKMNDLVDCSETIHYVMEGTGFKNSILRSVVTNILMLTGKRNKIFVHKTFEEALKALDERLQALNIMPSRVHLAAQSKGLLQPVRPVQPRPRLFG